MNRSFSLSLFAYIFQLQAGHMAGKQMGLLHGHLHKVPLTKLGIAPRQDLREYLAVGDLLGDQQAPAMANTKAAGTQAHSVGHSGKIKSQL